MYITSAAARRRRRVSVIVEEMAFADPVKTPLTLLGKVLAEISSTRCKPLLGAIPSARENRIVAAGSCSRLARSGEPNFSFQSANAFKGTKVPIGVVR